jgi:hypothetical protein
MKFLGCSVLSLAVLAVPELSIAGDAMPSAQAVRSSVMLAHSSYVKAEQAGNLARVAKVVGAGTSSGDARRMESHNYVTYLLRVRNAGVRLLAREVRSVEVVSDGTRYAAFLNVSSTYSNPLPNAPKVSHSHTVIGLSRGGLEWRFVTPGCTEESTVKEFLPAYKGHPSIEVP